MYPTPLTSATPKHYGPSTRILELIAAILELTTGVLEFIPSIVGPHNSNGHTTALRTRRVFRSKNFSYDYFPWSPNFSNYSRETSSEARRFDTWDKALKDMDSMIFNSNHMYQCHDRAAEIPIAPYRYWCGEMNKLGSKFPDWQKEIQDLETRVWVVETREAYKTLGIDPGLVWVPPGYVEEAPEAGAQ